jgi:hypothetical protein
MYSNLFCVLVGKGHPEEVCSSKYESKQIYCAKDPVVASLTWKENRIFKDF